MRGLGTLVNTAAVIVGGLLGLLLKKGLSKTIQDTLTKACGISTILIGAGGVMQQMLYVGEDGVSLSSQGTLLLILSMVLGGIAGELLALEDRLNGIGEKLKSRVHAGDDSPFVQGFVSASLVICVGAMAIVGSIEDGLSGDHALLFAKSVLDFVIVMVLASACGVGAVFSALPLFIYQSAFTLLGVAVGSVVSQELIAELSYVGSALIFCVGINLCFGPRIRTGNYLPAMLVPVFWELIQKLF